MLLFYLVRSFVRFTLLTRLPSATRTRLLVLPLLSIQPLSAPSYFTFVLATGAIVHRVENRTSVFPLLSFPKNLRLAREFSFPGTASSSPLMRGWRTRETDTIMKPTCMILYFNSMAFSILDLLRNRCVGCVLQFVFVLSYSENWQLVTKVTIVHVRLFLRKYNDTFVFLIFTRSVHCSKVANEKQVC